MEKYLELIVIAVAGIWGIYQTRLGIKLNHDMQRLIAKSDQKIQRLHKARDLAQQTFVLYMWGMLRQKENHGSLFNSLSAYTELKALTLVIKDDSLHQLVWVELLKIHELIFGQSANTPDEIISKVDIQLAFVMTAIYERIYELIEEATSK